MNIDAIGTPAAVPPSAAEERRLIAKIVAAICVVCLMVTLLAS